MKSDFYIDRVDKEYSKDLLYNHHYLKDESKDFKSGYNYGLFRHTDWDCPLNIGGCLAVCIFTGLPVPEIAKGAFGLERNQQEGLFELSRLCVDPELQKQEYNITSWFVSRCIRRFKKDANVRAILSYADSAHHTGIIYRALGIPTEMFTVMFALGRLPGWIAQWLEMRKNNEPIGRPRQIYTGKTERSF